MEAMRVMEIRAGSTGYLRPRPKAIVVMEEGVMDNGEELL